MQSRKSSILKPRKVREPLQDLNQLLPNNDDEETTTTDAQRRRVSFASMNKVKEYETASECVSVISAPPIYDKCYSLSTDVYQPPIPGKDANETYQVANVSKKSIQSTFKASTARRSVAEENIYIEEDVELTETIGRIYDIPMKSSGDSSMELTHVISQTEKHYDERSEEIVGPLNLTKENLNQIGSSFADAHILEIEIVDKNEKDADTSSMETTEVISNNVIRFENPDSGTLSMETTEVISNNIIRIEKPDYRLCSMGIIEAIPSDFDKNTNENNSSMETTEVIYENMLSTSLKSQSVFFETLQSSAVVDDTINRDKDVEYLSVRNFDSPNAFPKRKSIFETSNRPLTNWKSTPMSNINREKSNYSSSSMKLTSGHDSNLIARNDSLSLTCQDMANRIDDSITNVQVLSQEVEQRLNITSERKLTDDITGEVKFNTGIIKTSTQKTNDTQEDNQSKGNHSHIEPLTQEDKTKCNNSNMELLTQEDKTKCNNSNMELLTQEDKTKCNNSNMELLTQEENKTKYTNSNMELLSQEEEIKYHKSAVESILEDTKNFDNLNLRAPHVKEKSYRLSTNISPAMLDEYETAEKSYVNMKMNNTTTPMRANLSLSNSLNLPKIVPPAVDVFSEFESINEQVEVNLNVDPQNGIHPQSTTAVGVNEINDLKNVNKPAEVTLNADSQNSIHPQPTTTVSVNEINDLKNVPQETTLKSSQADDSSANDSNSPLTVDVNFSIFQKNKETRVEFSGTIDSIKKRQSISNVKVNIINNKTEKSNKHVKELRFSMPATTKYSHEPEAKTEFSATFTDFSIQNDDMSLPQNQKLIAKENIAEHVSVACPQPIESTDFNAFNTDKVNIEYLQPIESASTDAFNTENVNAEHPQPTESTDATVLNSSLVLNGDMLNAQLAKPTKKRLSNDAFNDTEENPVCPKRRSLSNNMDESNRITASVSPESIGSSNSSASLVQRSITEVKQRKESFVREEKSILTIDDVVVETCSRSMNMNVSYEACQTVSVVHHAENFIQQPSPIQELGSNPMTSGISSSEIDPPCAKAAVANISNAELSDGESGCRSQSLNQSSSQEEINDYSLHNPSIIVNIGDSFSHYKSMDLGTDNVSVSEPVVDENKGSPPVIDYIESDGISKENFVVEWLQNKTGKTNVETKLFSSSSDSSSMATVKSATRGTEKSSATITSDTFHPTETDGSQLTHLEAMTIDRVEDDLKCNVNASEELAEVCDIRTSEEKEEPILTENQNTNTVPSIPEESAVSESESQAEVMAQINHPPNRMEVTDQNYSEKDPNLPKSTKIRSVDPVFVSSESTSEKRQKMSPEYERGQIETEQIIKTDTMLQIKKEAEPVVEESTALIMKKETKPANEKNQMQNQQVMKPRNVFNVASGGHNENKLTKKPDKHPHRHQKFMTTRKDILEKIEAAKNDKQKWKLKVVSEDEWIFQFFFDQLELVIKFDNEESSNICNAICQYVQPPNIKYYEICKIAIEYLIRKNESKLKKICQTVEDVPYLLRLIEPDIIYIENFVADILKLCDSEIFKIKNGRAVFYVYSFKNIMSAKIHINLTRLEKLSVKDIHVEEIVGKTDLNLIRSTFCEAGKESDFMSKFVNKLWIVLDE